jgi:FAD/FMN-containing dehydrogenase
MGGAVSRIDPQATAFYHRDAAFSLNLFSTWADARDDAQNIAWLHSVWDAIQPFLGEGVYVNVLFDEGADRVRAAYGPAYERLVQLKQKYDPDNLFRFNANIV